MIVYPLIFPYDNGTSTFNDWNQTIIKNIKIVLIIARAADVNSVGALLIKDWIKTKTFPEQAVWLKSNKQFFPCWFMN